MYLGIDVGASKILFAVFEPGGKKVSEHKVKTPRDYQNFLAAIKQAVHVDLSSYHFSWACCGIPGWIDFKKGVAVGFGNLPWQNVPVKTDLQQQLTSINLLIHNDSKLAGLSEAVLVMDKYKKVLYMTISTGIGGGVIVDGKIAAGFENFEPGQMVFEYGGKPVQWEDIASGRTLKARYGKLASEINDPVIWQEYSKSLVIGFEDVLANVQPDVVIIGGGVGAHFEKFKSYLEEGLKQINNPLVPTPPLLKAQRSEEAVIYGCYEYIKQNV
jgi:predicted NBD/HSP70 family sugar kinase